MDIGQVLWRTLFSATLINFKFRDGLSIEYFVDNLYIKIKNVDNL